MKKFDKFNQELCVGDIVEHDWFQDPVEVIDLGLEVVMGFHHFVGQVLQEHKVAPMWMPSKLCTKIQTQKALWIKLAN